MTRQEANKIIQFAVRVRARIEIIRTNLYSSNVQYDEDYILSSLMAIDHLMDTISGLTRMLDDNVPYQTLEDVGEEEGWLPE